MSRSDPRSRGRTFAHESPIRRHPRARAALAVALILGGLIAACEDSTGGGATSTASAPPSGGTSAATTTATATQTSTASPTATQTATATATSTATATLTATPSSGAPFDRFEVVSPGYDAAAGPFATLVDVRLARHQGFDRFVIEFREAAVPPYRIAYETPPASQCGSGMPVPLAGDALLQVTLRNAYAYDPNAGTATLAQTRFTPGYPAMVEAELTCAFEAVAGWALGIRERAPFRAVTLSSPARLVIDVAHP